MTGIKELDWIKTSFPDAGALINLTDRYEEWMPRKSGIIKGCTGRNVRAHGQKY